LNHDRLLADIEQAEGFRRIAYRDTLGNWTAGYGHLLTPQTDDWTGKEFDRPTIEQWLSQDIEAAAVQAQKLGEWAVLDTDARENAVIELVFNMGLGHWREFVLSRAALQQKNWTRASTQLLNSTWARQVGERRSTRIANYILTGVFDNGT